MNHKSLFVLLLGMVGALEARAQPTVDFVITNRVAEPHGIAVDAENVFYITDSADHRIFKYDPDNGSLTSLAGVSGQPGTDNGPGFVARFFSPKGVVLARGGLVVADSGNHALRFLTLTGRVSVVSNFAGVPGTPGAGDGPAASARFNNPNGLAVDSAGNIYVADSKNNAIRKIDVNNVVSTIATNFSQPAALAIGGAGELYVADTRNHSIKVINPSGEVRLLAGGNSPTRTGTNDSFFAEEALFNSPGGLLWLGGNTGLLVADSGNHTLRRIFFDPIVASFFPEKTGYSVETYAGAPGELGFVDGLALAARFNSPASLARDFDHGVLVTELGNRAVRRIQTTPRLPRVSNPKIGRVIFVFDEKAGGFVSQLVPFSDAIFNNEVIIALLTEGQTETFFTSGKTPGLFEADTIPLPTSLNSQPAPPYADGLPPSQVKPTIVESRPDLTIKAISLAEGRRPSEVVQARVQFKVATPTIQGDNPASFRLATETVGADLWYTIDGTTPTNEPPSIQASSDIVSIRITEPVTFRARAFKRNYKPSEITTKTFFPADFEANRITFGFERGEASSFFLGSPGQVYIAPVTLSLLPSAKIYALQFNLIVTNAPGSPPVAPGAVGFESMLIEREQEPVPGFFIDRIIEPKMFERYRVDIFTNISGENEIVSTNFIPIFRDLLFTNTAENLLGVGWFELVGKTNLYHTVDHDLVAFSRAHDRRFLSSEGKVVLGGYRFTVPGTAPDGSIYRIRITRPSGSDLNSKDVFIDTPTEGALGAGSINSVKEVRVVSGGIGAGQLHYIVGDVSPFRWFNVSEFGDTNILNSDVLQAFHAGVYQFNVPPTGTDFFDAMDSCCNGASGPIPFNPYVGNETNINSVLFGDGVLNLADVYVTYRRSLDPALKWFARFWANGRRQAAEVPNLFRGERSRIPRPDRATLANLAAETLSTSGAQSSPSVAFRVEDVRAEPGKALAIPVRADVFGGVPVRVLMLNLSVEALEGAPAVTEPVQFIPAAQLGRPALTASLHPANYAAAWLDERVPGLTGPAIVGTLHVVIPAKASAASTYRVHFEHISASPNGLSVLPQQTTDGLLSGADRPSSSFGDGIPDSWRLRYFGSVLNHLSHAEADADGDGVPNWQEFKAGTHPNDVRSHLRVLAEKTSADSPRRIMLRWPSAPGRSYSVEVSPSVGNPNWVALAPKLPGTGGQMEFRISNPADTPQFYRVRLVE